jgi:hypothetical protein
LTGVLHTELLRLINTQEMWAFVGSGPSVDAGAPSWGDLVDAIAALPEAAATASDAAYRAAVNERKYPLALEYLSQGLDAEVVRDTVEAEISKARPAARLYQLLAQIPFAGYVTTNYDGLLEEALLARGESWISVGNTDDEARKVAGGAERLVWHIHGGIALPKDRSRLILTQSDYDSLYAPGSHVLATMQALMIQRRLMFVGFGFADNDVERVLRIVGDMTDPARPAYALIEKAGPFSSDQGRSVFLRQHNIDAIPYTVQDRSHRQLADMLEVYAALSIPRTQDSRSASNLPTPQDLDPETMGLLLYNELVLTRGVGVPQEVQTALLEAHILARIATKGHTSTTKLAKDLADVAQQLGRRITDTASSTDADRLIAAALNALRDSGYISSGEDAIALTDAGREAVATKLTAAQLLSDRFRASLSVRAATGGARDSETRERVVVSAEAYFKDCLTRRALGVAMALSVGGPSQQEYHAVSLLQSLRPWVIAAPTPQEARLLVDVVQGVYRAPTADEKEFIGVTVQARFGIHLLGLDPDTLSARTTEIQDAYFVLDSSTLIPLLAIDSVGHAAANQLVQRLHDSGAHLVTTRRLVAETSEHARWAQSRVRENPDHSYLALSTISAATGRYGQRSNAFLEGFLARVARGEGSRHLDTYLRETCRLGLPDRRGDFQDGSVISALRDLHDIATINTDALSGFTRDDRKLRDTYQAELQEKRVLAETFRRNRQVAAEADVMVLVEGLRIGRFRFGERTASRAFFISNTRIIDEIARLEPPIVMRPEATLEWLLTLRPASIEDVSTLASNLLWELQERGQGLVDPQLLSVAFRPLIEASEARKGEELERLRRLEADRYAGFKASLTTAHGLDLPVVVDAMYAQRIASLEAALKDAQATGAPLADLSKEEKQELERFRKKERGRRRVVRRDERMGRRRKPPSE